MSTPKNAAHALAATETHAAQLQGALDCCEKTHNLYRQAIRANIDAALEIHIKLKGAKESMVRDRNTLYTETLSPTHLPVEIFRRVLDYLFAMDVDGRNGTADWASHDDIIAEFLATCRNAASVIPPIHLAAHRMRAWGTCAWRPFARYNRVAVRQKHAAMTWNRVRRVLDSRAYGKRGWLQVQSHLPWKTRYITATSMANLIDSAVRRGMIERLKFAYKDCPGLKIVVFGKLGLVEIHHPRAEVIGRILKARLDIPSFSSVNRCYPTGDLTLTPDHTAIYVPYAPGRYAYHMGHGGRVAVTDFF